ncbi:hypothetical protein PTKIN_Ptkin05aG0050300 [Pterospermum kingtungense]
MRPSPVSDNMQGDESAASLYRVLVDRCLSLEASHAKLREELDELVEQDKRNGSTDENMVMVAASYAHYATSFSGALPFPGYFSSGSPFRNVLESIGHAIHVCSAVSGKITYWNHSAEKLFGWMSSEVLGRRDSELLIAGEHYEFLKKIMEKISSGQTWSGQFPFKRRSGEMFMALVTKSPLYEDGQLTGIVTVSSNAAVFNGMNLEDLGTYQDHGRQRRLKMKSIQWHPPRPQLPSSVSNLASRFLLKKQDGMSNACGRDDKGDTAISTQAVRALFRHLSWFICSCRADIKLILFMFPFVSFKEGKFNSDYREGRNTDEGTSSQKDENAFDLAQPSKIAAKVLAKLHIRGTSNLVNEDDESLRQKGSTGRLGRNYVTDEPNGLRCSKASTPNQSNSSYRTENAISRDQMHARPASIEEKFVFYSSRECNGHFGATRIGDSTARLVCQVNESRLELESPNMDASEMEDELQKHTDGKNFSSFGESSSSQGTSSSKGDNELNSMVDCDIRWEDLQLMEEVGQGSFAVVYHGIWNGSDVAIKVYFAGEYKELTLLDYKKEIDIMRKLRHPNVLLFMGAVYSQERLAIVTEFLPRGSLFKTLHKNNQALDVRRRMKMALDVARGMNYLHHRNPPIVHRDLKSSNLLVDKNWNVKVGDFGLSKWKNATFLSTKSGRGTPQWMAPEVLRNEPSNEKSDVFSFGVILWELMTVSIPWNNLNSLQVVGVVGFMDRRLDLPESLDPQIASIIRDCWRSCVQRSSDPGNRPSFEDIINRMTDVVPKSAVGLARRNSEP